MANVVRDQLTAFINAERGAAGSAASQAAASLRAFDEAVRHGPVYHEMLREGGLGTSFDLARNEIPQTVERIQSTASAGRRLHYIATHPGEWLREAENLVARGEEFTRIQQYIAEKQVALKKGMPETEARIAAARAARQNTVNFARRGEWGSQLNAMWLYLNANIQGTRQLLRSFRLHPAATTAKIGAALLAPVAAATAWNMGDPRRRFAYEDVADFEKENNLILIPPNPTRDAEGKWNVVKIPISQEVNNIMQPFRRGVEQLYGGVPLKATEVAGAAIGTVSPINPTEGTARSTLTPQIIKPSIEASLNKNFFTGSDVVPESLKRRPPKMQVKPGVSATAKEIGGAIGVSPLKVEFWLRETFGGVASQGLNAIDNAQAAVGIIPPEEVGGESIGKGSLRRFFKAVGGEHLRRARSGAPVQGRRD